MYKNNRSLVFLYYYCTIIASLAVTQHILNGHGLMPENSSYKKYKMILLLLSFILAISYSPVNFANATKQTSKEKTKKLKAMAKAFERAEKHRKKILQNANG